MTKTLGQIACEAVSGPTGWDRCAKVHGLHDMWETAAKAVAAAENARWDRVGELAKQCAEWHLGDGDECGKVARELFQLLRPTPR